METNPIHDAKNGTRPTFGPWLTVGNTFIAEALARQGFDYVAIDLQHGSIGWDALGPAIQAIELGGSCAVVRVPWNAPDYIMRALDLGAVGVIVPMVSSAAEARAASEAVRYPPRGNRSYGPTRSYHSLAGSPVEPACLVMIETRGGLENIRDIAATPGVDGLFLGPADLSLDLGLPLSLVPAQPVLDAVDAMVAACAGPGVVPGAASFDPVSGEDFLKRGVRFLTLGGDMAYLRRGAQQDADFIKRWK